jgi:hypothetical protein
MKLFLSFFLFIYAYFISVLGFPGHPVDVPVPPAGADYDVSPGPSQEAAGRAGRLPQVQSEGFTQGIQPVELRMVIVINIGCFMLMVCV